MFRLDLVHAFVLKRGLAPLRPFGHQTLILERMLFRHLSNFVDLLGFEPKSPDYPRQALALC